MKRQRLRLFVWSIENWLRGYAFGPVKRCRTCDHSVYPSTYETHRRLYCEK